MPKTAFLKSSLDLMYYSGATAVLRGLASGMGAIFMLHHVFPGGGRQGGFAPNAVLEIDPDFLDQIIGLVKADGYELVSLDEAVRRVREGRSGRPFAAFTLDDGYRDNLVHAKPVFDRHQCPYTIYVATSIIDGTCELWWRALELAIARSSRVTAVVEGRSYDLEAGSPEQKWAAWHALYWPVRQLDQKAQRDWIRSFSRQNGIDLGQMCREAAMTWNDLRGLAADPLCSIGAHTENHYALAALSPCDAAAEMIGSADRIERELGTRPVHFAYPYGDANSAGPRDFRIAAEAGFKSAVTTRKGLIYRSHADHLHALPRLSLTGELQEPRYVQSLLTGVPFLIYNRLQRLNVN
jgi:peptidoglycan/xylan/chitin deacetylase (PgdA/CDA1 family)